MFKLLEINWVKLTTFSHTTSIFQCSDIGQFYFLVTKEVWILKLHMLGYREDLIQNSLLQNVLTFERTIKMIVFAMSQMHLAQVMPMLFPPQGTIARHAQPQV
jgi:hypothetical protein